jgi:hypothetical protein
MDVVNYIFLEFKTSRFNTVGIHRGYMAGEDHRGLKKIQCWIPVSTWEQIEATGYTSPKLAMTKAIELLLGDFTGSWGDLKGVSGDSCESTEIPELKARIEEKDKQIEEKNHQIEVLNKELLHGDSVGSHDDLQGSSGDIRGSSGDLKGISGNRTRSNGDLYGSTEIPELKARIEEKDKQIEEKERHIETLQRDLENSQETHRNYMMQIQTLITQKQIEAPGAKKPWWRFW